MARTRIVSLINEKGGVAKTTTTVALAAAMAEAGQKVMVIDADPQQSLTWWAEGGGDAGAGFNFDYVTDTDPRALSRLRELRDYDIVFVDAPGNKSGEATHVLQAMLAASDYAILPMEPAAMSVPPTHNTITQLVKPAGVPYRVLITRVDPRALGDVEDIRALMTKHEHPVFRAFARTLKAHSMAVLENTTMLNVKHASQPKAVDDYRRIAVELLTDWARDTAPEPRPNLSAVGE
jgi:chromosome partitioning protein